MWLVSVATVACAAVAWQEGVGAETLRWWGLQAEIDAGIWSGITSEEHEQIKRLKVENARLREDVAILKAAATFFARGTRPPQSLIAGFIDTMRSEGHVVESVCRVLRGQGCQVAVCTYRAWKARVPSGQGCQRCHGRGGGRPVCLGP